MARTYCYLCATKLEPKSEASWWCPSCQYIQYENAKPTAELILFSAGKILISERGIEPYKGTFDMPGGFANLHEKLEQAAIREAEEELGITADDISELHYLRSFNASYPYKKETYRVMVAVFCAYLRNGGKATAKDDVASSRWITEEEIETVNWALPEHRQNAIQAFAYFNHAAKLQSGLSGRP